MARYAAIPNVTNAVATVSTGTSLKTIIQLATPSTVMATIVSWWISFDGTSGTPIKVELIEADVAATVTALTPAKYSDPNAVASFCVGGTSATGYNASAEGTITATRLLDSQLISPATGVIVQYPLGREPVVNISKFLRLRVTAPASVNADAGIIWEE